MKAVTFASALATLCASVILPTAAMALPLGYESLQVTTAPDGFTFLANAVINNSGEIVYEKTDPISSQLISTRRGALSPALGSSLDGFDLDNYGHVDYSSYNGHILYSLDTFSQIGYGVGPKMNDLGYVAADSVGPVAGPSPIYPLGIYAPDGSITQVAIDPNVSIFRQVVGLTDANELLYLATSVNGSAELFSSTRGQVTHFGELGLQTVMANSSGEYSYVFNNSLYWEDGTRISDGIGICTDMNDLGDIVCNRERTFLEQPYPQFPPSNYGTFDTILFTTRADEYKQTDGFLATVPEPASMSLLSFGILILGLSVKGRRMLA